MKIDDEVFIRVLPHNKAKCPRLKMTTKSFSDLHHTDFVSHILGADSSLEHNKSFHFCHEGEMPVGGHRCG